MAWSDMSVSQLVLPPQTADLNGSSSSRERFVMAGGCDSPFGDKLNREYSDYECASLTDKVCSLVLYVLSVLMLGTPQNSDIGS